MTADGKPPTKGFGAVRLFEPDLPADAVPVPAPTPDNPAPPGAGENVASTPARPPSKPSVAAGPVAKLSIRDLGVTYVGRQGTMIEAVRGANIEIPDKPGVGEIIVLLGPSGCGKSTILKAVAGLLRPTAGSVLVNGKPVNGVGAECGMVFQQYTSFGWLTVRENVEYGLKLREKISFWEHAYSVTKLDKLFNPWEKRRAAKRKEISDHYLKLVGLLEFADQLPKSLSGGMKQRVAIARTLINKPKLVLMDEPFGALDPQTRWEMQTMILDIARKEDNTMVLVTHDVSEAVYVADTCYVLASRPTRVLHKVDVPDFGAKSAALKAAPEFREVEKKLLEMLYQTPKS